MKEKKQNIRSDFPFFCKKREDSNIIYFDNAATTQKPKSVINSISEFYESYNSNVHRGEHLLAGKATQIFEQTREIIKKHLNAKSIEEIIFTSGTTQSINLVANSFTEAFLKRGDVVLLGEMEHHSNIVPWQLACKKRGVKIKKLNLKNNGTVDLKMLKESIVEGVKLIACQHISNVTGLQNDIEEIVRICKKNNIYTFIDGAQAIAHQEVDVQNIDCDFYCFSGHKCFGPTGTGVLYGKQELLNAMPPYMGGGEMIESVSLKTSSWNRLPYKFEAGTPNIAGFIGLGQAFLYLKKIGLNEIQKLEKELSIVLYNEIKKINNIIIYSENEGGVPICTFNIKGLHGYDLGALLNEQGVCVRTGHLCAQPSTHLLNTNSFIRASLCFYNTKEEIYSFIERLKRANQILSK